MADAVRAAVLVAPGRHEVQEFPRPSLADGALLMQVEMSGICGTDKHTFLGETSSTPARRLKPTHRSQSSRDTRTSVRSQRSPYRRRKHRKRTAVGSP